jgi:cytokinesis protein
MDALLEKLKQAGPAHREKRETRRRAYMRGTGGKRTASGASRTASGTIIAGEGGGGENTDQLSSGETDVAPTTPNPLPTILSAEEEDTLSSKTQEMLMRLRGENSGDSTSPALTPAANGASNLRVRRRRGSGEDLRRERRRKQGSNVSSLTLEGGGASDAEDAVARAKMALMNMRRGSDVGEDDDAGLSSGGMPTPTTIVSPPSPVLEPKKDDD